MLIGGLLTRRQLTSPGIRMMSRLWTQSEFTYNGGSKVSLYKSTRSKLQIAVGDVPGPMVKGVVSFVTEANNNDGLPHTLEHLVFMGSKKYPFKGVLDIIANRCLASGTNAWTDQDHTAYTLSTVGSEGFFKVLPVYVNHLLQPTLTKEQYATEVHHINGEGEDGGVVYSEMQDHESEMENIMHIRTQELLYPPNNPYGVDTGGKLYNLRETCSIDKCRDFHRRFYHLSNMMITVCGKVDHNRLLELVSEIESDQLSSNPAEFPRPFNFSIPPIKESVDKRVTCPSDDASRGMVDVNWFGPSATELETHTALEVLFDYMENTAVAPLQKDFVNIPDPLASNATFSINEQTTSVITLRFSGVPTEKLGDVKQKFLDKTLHEHCEPSTFDIERMGYVVEQQILNTLARAENKAHDQIFSHMIGHQLYGKDDDKLLKTRFNEVDVLRRLKSEPAQFWSDLVRKYLTSPSVTIIGVPDEQMVDQIAGKEASRLDSQRKNLGEEGLLKASEDLQQAIETNTALKPPQSLLDELIVRNLETFDRFPIHSESNLNGSSNEFLQQFKFPATIHTAPTRFVNLFLLLDTGNLTMDERAWLMLFCELMFESPANIDGKLHSAEEISKLFTRDLIDHSIDIGVSGYYDRIISLVLKVDSSKFSNLAKWSEIFTKGIVYDPKRVKSVAQRLASEAREKKRDGCDVASSAITTLCYNSNSNTALYDVIVLEKLHEKIAKLCDQTPEKVIKRLSQVRDAVLARGVNAHFICDPSLLDKKEFGGWDALNGAGTAEVFKCPTGESVLPPDVQDKNVVIGVGGSESSFIYQSALTGIDWLSPELVPLMLFTQYLSQTEGPLWRGIRGDGLAYGANIYTKPDRKMVTLSLYRCANPSQAYEQSKKIVEAIRTPADIDESELEAAKRSLVYELMQREDSVTGAGKMAILSGFRGTHKDYVREMCARIWNATTDEVIGQGAPIVRGLFQNYTRAIALHPSKVDEIKKHFPGIRSQPISTLYYKPGDL